MFDFWVRRTREWTLRNGFLSFLSDSGDGLVTWHSSFVPMLEPLAIKRRKKDRAAGWKLACFLIFVGFISTCQTKTRLKEGVMAPKPQEAGIPPSSIPQMVPASAHVAEEQSGEKIEVEAINEYEKPKSMLELHAERREAQASVLSKEFVLGDFILAPMPNFEVKPIWKHPKSRDLKRILDNLQTACDWPFAGQNINEVMTKLGLERAAFFEGGAPGTGRVGMIRTSKTLQVLEKKVRSNELWPALAQVLECEQLFIYDESYSKNRILEPRRWCRRVSGSGICRVAITDPGPVRLIWDPTKTDFAVGNIVQRLELSTIDCTDEVVIDAFAGIGQFTLHFLCNSNASVVHSFEANPNSTSLLKLNLKENCKRYEGRECKVYETPFTASKLRNVADRIYLGLLPSSEHGFVAACYALKPEGGIVHVHAMVQVDARTPELRERQRYEHGLSVAYQFRSLMKNVKPGRYKIVMKKINRIRICPEKTEHLSVEVEMSLENLRPKDRAIAYYNQFARSFSKVSAVMAVVGCCMSVYQNWRDNKVRRALGLPLQ